MNPINSGLEAVVALVVLVAGPLIIMGMGREKKVIDRANSGEGTPDDEIRNNNFLFVAVVIIVCVGVLAALADANIIP